MKYSYYNAAKKYIHESVCAGHTPLVLTVVLRARGQMSRVGYWLEGRRLEKDTPSAMMLVLIEKELSKSNRVAWLSHYPVSSLVHVHLGYP